MRTLETMLRESLWAGTLTADEMDQVLAETVERFVPVGAQIVRCGEPADFWFGIIEGLIKMSVSQPDGRHSTFTGVTAGGWAGEGSLLNEGSRWRYDGVAVRDSRVACMPRRLFRQLVNTSLPFNHYLLRQLNARLSLFIGLVEYDRLLGPDARVARCIASLFDPDLYPSTGTFVQLSQEEIGLLSGVSRQRANAALRALERDGLLRIGFGGVHVLDIAGLRRWGQQADVPARNTSTPGAARPRPLEVATMRA